MELNTFSKQGNNMENKLFLEIIGKSRFALDIETTGLNPFSTGSGLFAEQEKILLISVSDGVKAAAVEWSVDVSKALANVRNAEILGYNLKFDLLFLRCRGCIIHQSNKIVDLMLAYRILTAGYPLNTDRSLRGALSKVLGIELNKEVRKEFIGHTGKITREQLDYAKKDTLFLDRLYKELLDKLKVHKLVNVFNLECDVLKVFVSMEYNGVMIDLKEYNDLFISLQDKLNKQRDVLLTELKCTATQLNDPRYLLTVLQYKGIKPEARIKNAETKEWEIKPSTNNAALEQLISETNDDYVKNLLNNILDYRETFKLYGYREGLTPRDGRVHCSFNQIGTDTGRVSCKSPNLQQVPQKFRSIFKSKGYVITADYSNCEMRILAEAADETAMIDAFKKGEDIHSYMAMLMFPDKGEISKKVNKHLRDQQKAINFGVLYGAGAVKLKDDFGGDEEAAKVALQKFHNTFKKVKAYQEWSKEDTLKNKFSTTLSPYNRKRYFPTFTNSKEDEGIANREGTNHRIQGTNADMTKLAMVYVHKYLSSLDNNLLKCRIVNVVHDEIVIESFFDAEKTKEIADKVKELMLKAASEILVKVPMEVDCVVSDAWSK